MFGTSGVRGRVGDEVTASLALDAGRALASTGRDTVLVGRDCRESGRMLADALAAGLAECGADVVDVGLAATPTVARGVVARDADAGVVVTASHNPSTDNGLKLWDESGRAFDGARRDEIARAVADGAFDLAAWDGTGRRRSWNGARDHHRERLVEAVGDTDVDGLAVVVDVGNGAGGVTADALVRLGCSVTTLNAQPDGRFPGRPSEPTAEHCARLREHVAATDADLGLAHDGDADRLLAVDETGAWVGGDELLALFGRAAAGEGERVAAPVNTSLAVDEALADVGATVTRTRVGDVHVADRVAEPDVAFGGEPSGAWIWPDETPCPDGPLAACELVATVAREGPLSALVNALASMPTRRESVELTESEKGDRMTRVRERLLDGHDEDVVSTVDGVRVDHGDGWTLVRASGTQPLIRVTAEARDPERADELLADARAVVEESGA